MRWRARLESRRFSAALLGVAIALASAAPSKAENPTELDAGIEGFYILNFNYSGELDAPFERDQIIQDLSEKSDIERVLIISYGWANDGEGSYGIYRELVYDLLADRPNDSRQPPPKTIVIGIGWDSSQTGFRKLASNLIPFPVLASWLAYLPDNLLFPISFWSKAAMADRIGYHGLREALNEIFGSVYPDGRNHPEIVLIGHSFGTRIVSGLMQNELALAKVRSAPFISAKHVGAAILIQPALVLPNIHREAEYPILITQSRHDHANSFLFPTANLAVNAYSFTSFEAIARQRVFDVVAEQVDKRTTQAVQLVLPGFRNKDENEDQQRNDGDGVLSGFSIPAPPLADRPLDLLRMGLAELASVPFSLLYSAVTTPVNYAVTQWRGLRRGPHNHLMDTLAQLPVLEVFVDLAGDAVGHEPAWGSRNKGFLDLGLLNESSGRLFVEPYAEPDHFPVVSVEEIQTGVAQTRLGCKLSDCKGPIFVDSSTIIDTGIFGVSLENRAIDYTLGWLDPIGSHANYRNPEVVELMMRVVRPPAQLSPN
ncbi:MAG: hypothetical protein VX246_03880 [Myxococcota bacterium]|nr:hypothetical protein [Myxococcota bacterium]